MTVDNGIIASVETLEAAVVPADSVTLDYRGCTIIPGLIDSHCHLALQPELGTDASISFVTQAAESEVLAVMRRNATRALVSGVTTMRDCGSPGKTGVLFRQEAADARNAFPNVLVSGRPITTRQGHCAWMGLAAESSTELVEAVRTLVREGVDFIKVMATGGMMTETSDPYRAQYKESELRELVREAKRHARKVAAHALSADGVRAAVAAGVDTVEHCVTTTSARQDYEPSLNAVIAEAGVVVGVTAHKPLRDLLDAGDTGELRKRLTPHRELRAAGVVMTVHSDAGPPGSAFDELAKSIEIFKIGLDASIHEALRAATLSAAMALGIESRTGALIPGKSADFVLLDGDLAEDDRALRRVVAVARDAEFADVRCD